jgi:TRAP-type uncharacterized transport system substrate-binding protein
MILRAFIASGFFSLLLDATASAQENKLLVADASSSGTYAAMVGEIKKFCSGDALTIEEIKVSGGATDNLAALVNNRASLAFLHSDVIFAMSQSDAKYRQLKTLVALYPEEIHILALKNSGIKVGQRLGFGGSEVVFKDLASLNGYKVGAAGGGVYTARILTGQGEGHFDVVPFDSGKELIPALDGGQIQAVIFVGGAPLANVEALDFNRYKLLPITEPMATKVQAIYRPATLSYKNSGIIRTLAPDAIALTRKYTTPRMVAPQRAFRTCFYEHLDDLRETPGMHPKWQQVDASNHGTWEWYEIPGDVASAPVPRAETSHGLLKKKP